MKVSNMNVTYMTPVPTNEFERSFIVTFGQFGLVETFLVNTVRVSDKAGMIVWNKLVAMFDDIEWNLDSDLVLN
jgi:hypothetical protein